MTFPNTPGTDLQPMDREYVLRVYNHRYTGDHRPRWAAENRRPGNPYPLQFKDDADWLANTLFATTKNGRLDKRNNACFSAPTWPENPELRKAK